MPNRFAIECLMWYAAHNRRRMLTTLLTTFLYAAMTKIEFVLRTLSQGDQFLLYPVAPAMTNFVGHISTNSNPIPLLTYSHTCADWNSAFFCYLIRSLH